MRNALKTKLLSIAMVAALAVTMMPVMAFATETGNGSGTVDQTAVLAAQTVLKNPTKTNGVTTWDCVYFGRFQQGSDGNGEFITEPIK